MFKVTRVDLSNAGLVSNGLSHLYEQCSLPVLEQLAADDRTYFFVCYSDDTLVGYVLAYRFPSLYTIQSLGYLYDIEVPEGHRRRGIGRKLIEELLAVLKADGVAELWLGTATDNIAGQALFRSTGAEKSEETFNDYTYTL